MGPPGIEDHLHHSPRGTLFFVGRAWNRARSARISALQLRVLYRETDPRRLGCPEGYSGATPMGVGEVRPIRDGLKFGLLDGPASRSPM